MAVSSTWSEFKGLSWYIELSHLLNDDEKLYLVGVDDKIKALLPSNVVCIPRLSSVNELAFVYRNADVVLSLSKDETFGLTIVEGMACGKPTIVFNSTALPELITPETGTVVDVGDVKGVVNAMRNILSANGQNREVFCRERAVDYYSIEKQITSYKTLYNRVINT